MGELVEGEGKRVRVWAFYVFQGVLISKKRERFAVKTQTGHSARPSRNASHLHDTYRLHGKYEAAPICGAFS